VRYRRVLGFLVAAAALTPAPARAQETRAAIIEQQQAERAQQLQPPQPNPIESAIARLEDWGFISGAPRGPYPWFGSVYPGGGFAAGAGVRVPFGDDGALNAFGGYSVGTFSRLEVNAALPTFARSLARLTLSGRYVDAPDVRYYGTGNTSSRDDETRFGYAPRGFGAQLEIGGGGYLTLAGGVDRFDVETSPGRTPPSIETRFSPSTAAGLDVREFSFIRSTARAAFDWRKPLGYSGRGGLYRVHLEDYRERNDDLYSFRSFEADVLQLVPVLRANWVIALRGIVTVTNAEEGGLVPFFMLPSLGGGSTLRGYPDFRFRDRHRMLLNGELRWTPARFMDMAIFYDTGKVAARREDLDLDDLHDSYGIGMRLIGLAGYVFRIEVARSREHAARLLISAGGAF
jgi:hypothetical protein